MEEVEGFAYCMGPAKSKDVPFLALEYVVRDKDIFSNAWQNAVTSLL